MKEDFIKFLKENHAFKEYDMEVVADSTFNHNIQTVLDDIDNGKEDAEGLLEDGYAFFYDTAVTDIDWQALHDKWIMFLCVGGTA